MFGIIFTFINAVNLYMEENERAETETQADAIIEDQIEMELTNPCGGKKPLLEFPDDRNVLA